MKSYVEIKFKEKKKEKEDYAFTKRKSGLHNKPIWYLFLWGAGPYEVVLVSFHPLQWNPTATNPVIYPKILALFLS